MQQIDFHCKLCKKSLGISYYPTGNPDAVVLNGIIMKCHTKKCVRTLTLKNMTESYIVAHVDKNGKIFI